MKLFSLIFGAIFFGGGCVVLICAALNPEKWRKKLFEGWTGRQYGEDQQKRAPTKDVQRMTAIFGALVLGAFSTLFWVLVIEYKSPVTAAREKREFDSHMREFMEARRQESHEKFMEKTQAGPGGNRYPVQRGEQNDTPKQSNE
jgi:hypothetical protein